MSGDALFFVQKITLNVKKVICPKKVTTKAKVCAIITSRQRENGVERKLEKMVLVGILIVLVINEYSSGEGWYKGVIKGLVGASGLIWAATVSPARTFVICIMALCALMAVELARIDDRRKSAAERLKVLDERAEERKARNARRGLHLTRRSRRSRAA